MQLGPEKCQPVIRPSAVPDDKLDEHGMMLARAMLEARPNALRLTKRSLDAALEIGSADAAMELEERAQMLMIRGRRSLKKKRRVGPPPSFQV